jgi:transcriptional regulator with XRE-family HTH domain
MSFGDISARLKKKKEDEAPQAPVVRNHEEVHTLRARILGVLLRDARLANDKSEAELAQLLNVSEDQIRQWEFGDSAPSLPQLEMIAYSLGVPISHFWNTKTISTEEDERSVPENEYHLLRDRVIGAKLLLARQEAKLSREEMATASGLTPETIEQYEYGTASIPFPELTSLSTAVRKSLSYFLEDSSRVGTWLRLQEEYHRFSEMPEELRVFVTQPVNQPFIDIAMRLSRMPVQELRELGENILNITL